MSDWTQDSNGVWSLGGAPYRMPDAGAMDDWRSSYSEPGFSQLGELKPSTLPGISPVPGLAGSTLDYSKSSSGSTVGHGAVSPAGGSVAMPSAASAGMGSSAGTSSSSGAASGTFADYFARAIIVILGFIFVAVGLHMLAPSLVPDVRKVVR